MKKIMFFLLFILIYFVITVYAGSFVWMVSPKCNKSSKWKIKRDFKSCKVKEGNGFIMYNCGKHQNFFFAPSYKECRKIWRELKNKSSNPGKYFNR
jgi:outer membrane lipoprotein-sorting protein